MTAIANMMTQLNNGNYSYVANRILRKAFPVPNQIFYWDSFVMMKGMFKEKEVKSTKFKVEIYDPIDQKNNPNFNDLFAQFPEHDYNHDRAGKGTCFIVKNKDGEIASYAWMRFETSSYFMSNSGYKAYFNEKVGAWGYGFYVRPKYRLSTAFMLLTQAMRNLCLEAKCDTIYGETNMENQASQRSFGNLGKKVYEKVYMVSILGFKVYYAKGINSPSHLQFRWTNDTHQVSFIKNI